MPGCHRTTGIEVHHIVHWEHGGPTDTGNLLALCRRHHRLHHTGLLHITGDADLPRGTPGALTIADRWHRPLLAGPTPTACPDRRTAAEHLELDPGRYHHPIGERLDARCIEFRPDAPPPPSRPAGATGPHGTDPPTGRASSPDPASPPDERNRGHPRSRGDPARPTA